MEHSIYLSGMKKALRSRGITYEDLARRLKVTESGIKKMLNAKDISFRRLLQICDALDILPSELLALSEKASIPEVELTEQQQDALIKNRQLLAVYWTFAIEKREIAEIERVQRLSSNELKKLLQRLVTLDLLVQRRNQFYPKHTGKFKWSDKSILAQVLNKDWSELTLKRALNGKDKGVHRLVAMKLSAESYEALTKRLSDVLTEAAQLSEREEATLGKKNLTNITALVASVPKGIFDE